MRYVVGWELRGKDHRHGTEIEDFFSQLRRLLLGVVVPGVVVLVVGISRNPEGIDAIFEYLLVVWSES